MDITQIYQAIAAVSEKVNDISRRLDDCYKMITDNNTENIGINAAGIDGLAETVGMQNEALNDLAAAVAELE